MRRMRGKRRGRRAVAIGFEFDWPSSSSPLNFLLPPSGSAVAPHRPEHDGNSAVTHS